MSPKAYGNIHGSTDSEHLAALYHTHLGEDWDAEYPLDQMKRALELAILDVLALQRPPVGLPLPPLAGSSLNICTTDGRKMLAFRFRTSDDRQPPSLYISDKAGVLLNRKYVGHPDLGKEYKSGEHASGLTGDAVLRPELHGRHIIVSSEPTTRDEGDWKKVPVNKAILVDFAQPNPVRMEDINVL